MSSAFTLPDSLRRSPQKRQKRSGAAIALVFVAALLLLSAACVLLYVQGLRQERLAEHQNTTRCLLDSAMALASAQRLSALHDEPAGQTGQAWAELRVTLEHAGLEMLDGPAQWAPELAKVAGSLRLASLAPSSGLAETAWIALHDAQAAMESVLPGVRALDHYLGHGALILAVLWSFAAVAAFVAGTRTRLAGPRAARSSGELDHHLMHRLLQGLPGGTGSCGVIVIRLENLQDIADRHGRDAANATMEKIGQALHRSVRQDDVLARASDDAFVVLLTEATASMLNGATDRLRRVVENEPLPFRHEGEALRVVVASALSRPGESLDALIERVHAKLSVTLLATD